MEENFSMRTTTCYLLHRDKFQTRQPVFVQLLGAAFRVSQCSWLTVDQRVNVENCIRTLSEVAKARGIAIPSDLDIQVTAMFNKTALISRQTTTKWMQVARGPKREIVTPVNVSLAFL